MKEQRRCRAEHQKPLEENSFSEIAQKLLAWYRENHRELPWRFSQDPYHIWVSEVMAQQTRIETMLPYYQRFLEAFPDVDALAAASVDRVLVLWSGLGYYRRAENMHRAAKILQQEYNGTLPDSYEELKKLPGVGEYMAGAIASIAFNQSKPALDGNVKRVVARMEALREPFSSKKLHRFVHDWVMATIPDGQAGDFNQALMELGALICVPARPACSYCPIRRYCRAYQKELTDELPISIKKSRPKEEKKTVVLVLDQDRGVLMRKRADGLLRGLWEYVVIDGHFQKGQVMLKLEECGLTVCDLISIPTSRHVFSHRIWVMQGYQVKWCGNDCPANFQFVMIRELSNMAIPVAFGMQTQWLRENCER